MISYVSMLAKVIVSTDVVCFFFQAEDGIRDLVRSRGLGDVYKRQPAYCPRRFFPVPGFSVKEHNDF